LAVLIGIYDYRSIKNVWPNLKDQWVKKYKKPFWDILKVNLMVIINFLNQYLRILVNFVIAYLKFVILQTRPMMVLILCSLTPVFLRRYLRAIYEILFCAYVSKVFHDNKFGEALPPPPPPNAKKGKKK
jgi:hypothetical protein